MNHFKLFIGLIVFVMFFAASGTSRAGEIVIGYTGPLSGPAAEYGQDILYGVEMAVKEINAAGGVSVNGNKYTMKLLRADDRVDPVMATNNARRFKASGAVAVFNGVFTTVAPLLKINEEQGNEFIVSAYVSAEVGHARQQSFGDGHIGQ